MGFTHFSLFAQTSLNVKYNLKIEGGSKDGSRVVIERDGQRWRSRNGDDKNNNIELEFQHDYLFIFSKPGFVTKKIFFSTKVPNSLLKEGFNPYAFDITIFKQMEGVDLVVFNQPVARVIFNEDLDDFGYDTDYTKSVLSGIKEAEEELKKKIKEEKKNPKPPENTTPSQNQNTSIPPDETTIKKNSDAENKSAPKGEIDNGSRSRSSAKTESEIRSKTQAVNTPDTREEKQFIEANKRITQITITRKGKTYVYRKVMYVWGVFYFRDNVNITESAFIQEAL